MKVHYEVLDDALPYIDDVFDNLWQRGIDELAGLGLTVEQAKDRVREFCRQDYSRVLLADGEPVCVFGVFEGASWFQSTDAFTEHVVEITDCLRQLGRLVNCVIYSQCIHPQTERWFSICGYERDKSYQGQTVTGRPLYLFRRKDDVSELN